MKIRIPDARMHKPSPEDAKALIKKTKLTHDEIATRLGITDRSIRNYVRYGMPYPIQFCLESIARV